MVKPLKKRWPMVKDALDAWLQAAAEVGREMPEPGHLPSGQFIASP